MPVSLLVSHMPWPLNMCRRQLILSAIDSLGLRSLLEGSASKTYVPACEDGINREV